MKMLTRATALLVFLFGSLDSAPAQQAEIPYYVGRKVCLTCHSADSRAAACTLESIPEHDRSHESLLKPAATDIAAISGLPEAPHESRICLYCHATAGDVGPRWTRPTFDISDGVQCESCHNAGSLHVDQRSGGDVSSVSFPNLAGIQRSDRSLCDDCHRPRESHRMVLDQGWRRPETDARYKTPVNLTISPDGHRLYVVCENSNSLMVLDSQAGTVLQEIPVGLRPHDVAVSPDGRTLYVTNRLSDSVSVIDAAALQVAAEIPVGDDPHGLLVDPSGRWLYVLNTAEDTISVIETATQREHRRLLAGRRPWSLAVTPDENSFYVTSNWPNASPFRYPHESELTIISAREGAVRERPGVPEANMLEGIAALPTRNAVIFTMVRSKNLVPITRLAQGWTLTYGLGIYRPDGTVDQVLLDRPNASFPDPMDIAVSPDGRLALVTSGGTDQVAVVDVAALFDLIAGSSPQQRRDVLPNHLGLSERFVTKCIPTGSNPRGVTFSPNGERAYVANAMDDTVTVIDTTTLVVAGQLALGGPAEVTSTRWGAKLFHSADITFGRQFSCRSCHPDGHVNGLTFDIEADGLGRDPVDNRTLRGILDTAPFKWEGTNPTLRRQCGPRLAVFFTRLDPYTPQELAALDHYICTIEQPPNRYRNPDGLTPAQRRGKMIFDRTHTNYGLPIPRERQCLTCHNGAYRTAANKADVGSTMWFDAPIDVAVVDVEDLSDEVEEYGELGIYYFKDTGTPTRAFDSAHLTNIYDSPPYLHNGAAATLEEIWTRYDVLSTHGVTDDLTRRQFNDLMAYLRAL